MIDDGRTTVKAMKENSGRATVTPKKESNASIANSHVADAHGAVNNLRANLLAKIDDLVGLQADNDPVPKTTEDVPSGYLYQIQHNAIGIKSMVNEMMVALDRL